MHQQLDTAACLTLIDHDPLTPIQRGREVDRAESVERDGDDHSRGRERLAASCNHPLLVLLDRRDRCRQPQVGAAVGDQRLDQPGRPKL